MRKNSKKYLTPAVKSKLLALVLVLTVFVSYMSPVLPVLVKGNVVPSGESGYSMEDWMEQNKYESGHEELDVIPDSVDGTDISYRPPVTTSVKTSPIPQTSRPSTSSVSKVEKPVDDEPAIVYSDDELVLTGEANGITVIVQAERDAFPESVYMQVRPVEIDLSDVVDDTVGSAESFTAIDISFFDADYDVEIEPAKPIKVNMVSTDMLDADDAAVVHLDDEGAATVVDNTLKNDTVSFSSGEFSVYILVKKVIEKTVLASDGNNYNVTVTCLPETGITNAADLLVEEILPEDERFAGYVAESAAALGLEEENVTYSRFFDITIVDENGEELQPAEGTSVDVTISLADIEEDLNVLHFGEESIEIVEFATDGIDINFCAEGFSIYGVISGELITEWTLPGGDDIYEVSVTYGPEAGIPEGAYLVVTGFSADDEKYLATKEEVVKAKKQNDEEFDEDTLGLAVLDISIVDSDGNIVEPAESATVSVSIRLTSIPSDVDEEKLAGSVEVQHLREEDGSIVVDTVASGEDIVCDNGEVVAEFTVSSFSTYTITWEGSGRGTSNDSTTLRFRRGNGNTNVARTTVYFRDEDGNKITRPGQGNTDQNGPDNNSTTSYSMSESVLGTISGWSLVGVYRDEACTEPITDIVVSRGSAVPGDYDRSISFYNNGNQVGSTSYNSGNNYAEGGSIYAVYKQNDNSVTVHFIDRNGVELTGIKNPDGVQIDGNTIQLDSTSGVLDLSKYTKDGYTYANTRILGYEDAGRIIYPLIRFNNGSLQAITDQTNSGSAFPSYGSQNVRNFQNNEEIYVVMDPVPTTSGGSGSGSGTTPIADLPDPETSKDLTDNGDGTYDINLSITGKSDTKQENRNINVLFVIDNSSSMGSGSNSRLENTKQAVKDSAEELLKYNTQAHPKLVEVAAVSFDQDANDVCDWTSTLSTFQNKIGGYSTYGGTTGITIGDGTNWEDGLRKALSFGTGDGDPTYVIFFTDGMPYGYRGLDGDTQKVYKGSSNLPAMMAAKDEARAIVNSGRTLYSIFAYGTDSDYSADYLGQLTDYAYNDTTSRSTYYKKAASSTDVARALAEIVDSITQSAGFTNVKLTDGITGLTQSTIINGQAGEFRYYRSGGKNADDSEKYDSTANEGRGELWTTAQGAPAASYSPSTGVVWNLGENFILEDGVKYTVSFTVWPDQIAYDTLAAVSNAQDPEAAYNALDQSMKDQILRDPETGALSLKTNTSASASYTTIKTSTEIKLPEGAVSNGNNTWTYTDNTGKVWTYVKNSDNTYTGTTTQNKSLTYSDVPSISLDKTTMKVKKVWADGLTQGEDRPLSVIFTIYEDNVEYQTVTLSGTGDVWEQEINIAPGIYVTPGTHNTSATGDSAGILEGAEGHVYRIAETGYSYINKQGETVTVTGVENHYDFESDPVKPMLNGTTTTDKEDMIEYLTKTAWNAGEAALTATNTVKDGIYIYKKVTTDGTDEIDCDAEFTFKVTLKDADGNPVYITGTGVSGDLAWRIDDADETSQYGYTEKSRGYYTSEDGTVTLTMAADGRIRIVNVPVGTSFTVEEIPDTSLTGYEYYSSQVNEDTATTDNKAVGTTVGNKQWAVTVTNKREPLKVQVLKVDEALQTKVLEGAEFNLFESDGTTPAKDKAGNQIGTIATGADGKALIGSLIAGNYILKEVKAPDGYNIMSDNITITVGADNVTAMRGTSECAVEKATDGITYTITVTNRAGTVLPEAGGIGVERYYLLGGLTVLTSILWIYLKKKHYSFG